MHRICSAAAGKSETAMASAEALEQLEVAVDTMVLEGLCHEETV